MAKQTNALPSHSNLPLLCNYLAGAQIIVTDCGMELRTRAREEQKLLKLAVPLEQLQWNILRAIVANVCWSKACSSADLKECTLLKHYLFFLLPHPTQR